MPNQPFYNPLPGYRAIYPYGQVDFDFQLPNGAFTATTNILPSRFVTIDGSNSVRQSLIGDWPFAISQESTQAWNSQYAASPGYQLQTYGSSYECWLMLGGTVSAGDYLVSDDLGRGIVAGSTQQSSAKANENGVLGQLIRVRVLRINAQSAECYSDFSDEFDYEFGNNCGGVQP